MSVPGPIHVAVIDVGQPIVDLDCTRVCDPPYAAAWILACRDGRPLGSVELPLHQRRIPGEQLERELRAKLGAAWDRGGRAGRPAARAGHGRGSDRDVATRAASELRSGPDRARSPRLRSDRRRQPPGRSAPGRSARRPRRTRDAPRNLRRP